MCNRSHHSITTDHHLGGRVQLLEPRWTNQVSAGGGYLQPLRPSSVMICRVASRLDHVACVDAERPSTLCRHASLWPGQRQ